MTEEINGQTWKVFEEELKKGEIFWQLSLLGVYLNCKANCHRCPWGPHNNCVVGGPDNDIKIREKYPERFL